MALLLASDRQKWEKHDKGRLIRPTNDIAKCDFRVGPAVLRGIHLGR